MLFRSDESWLKEIVNVDVLFELFNEHSQGKDIDKALEALSITIKEILKMALAGGARCAIFKILGAGNEEEGSAKFMKNWFYSQKEFNFLYANMSEFKEFADSIHPTIMKKIKSVHKWEAVGSMRSGLVEICMYMLIIPLVIIIPLKLYWKKKMMEKTTDQLFQQILWACKESGWLQDAI